MPDEDFHQRIEDAIDRADATMLTQAEREMDLKTFIREERVKSDRFLGELSVHHRAMEKRLEDMGDQIRANTAATWKMLDRFN